MPEGNAVELLEILRVARSLGELWSSAAGILESFGLTHSIYTMVDPRRPNAARVWTSMPGGWRKRYTEQAFQDVDPFYRYCCTTLAPVRTGPDYLDDYVFLTEAERRVIQEGGETGFRSGFSSTVRLPGDGAFGGWNFGSTMPRREMDLFIKERGRDVRLAGFFVHEQVERFAGSKFGAGSRGALSPRERECLLWLARGLRTTAIADRLGIASVTVDLHFSGARRKLGAMTREEALAKAIVQGFIEP